MVGLWAWCGLLATIWRSLENVWIMWGKVQKFQDEKKSFLCFWKIFSFPWDHLSLNLNKSEALISMKSCVFHPPFFPFFFIIFPLDVILTWTFVSIGCFSVTLPSFIVTFSWLCFILSTLLRSDGPISLLVRGHAPQSMFVGFNQSSSTPTCVCVCVI